MLLLLKIKLTIIKDKFKMSKFSDVKDSFQRNSQLYLRKQQDQKNKMIREGKEVSGRGSCKMLGRGV